MSDQKIWHTMYLLQCPYFNPQDEERCRRGDGQWYHLYKHVVQLGWRMSSDASMCGEALNVTESKGYQSITIKAGINPQQARLDQVTMTQRGVCRGKHTFTAVVSSFVSFFLSFLSSFRSSFVRYITSSLSSFVRRFLFLRAF